MDTQFRDHFLKLWKRYFRSAEQPISYYYTAEVSKKDSSESRDTHRCLVCNLNRVREGHMFIFSKDSPGCQGGRRYSGFSITLRPEFEYFLSCGIPGKVEGERYKKSPDLVREYLKKS